MADVARPKFTRVPDAPKAEQASPSNMQKVQIAPAIVPHRVSREIGTLLVYLAGIVTGAIIVLVATTSMFDPIAKNNLQVLVAKHAFETTTGQ